MPQLADAVGDDGLTAPMPTVTVLNFCGVSNARQAYPRWRTRPAYVKITRRRRTTVRRTTGGIVQEAKVGEEKVQQEFGSDRFTVMAARATAVASTALAGKHSGLKLLRGVFAATRLPLITLDIIVSGLLKRGRAMVGLYAMIMAAAFTIVISPFLAGAEWPGLVIAAALIALAAGFIVFLRRHVKLMLFALLILAALWVWLLVIPKD